MTKPKAYLNALAEEVTRQDLIDWLVKLDAENDALRAKITKADYLLTQGAPTLECAEADGASHKTIATPDLRMVLEACRAIGMDGVDLED